MIMAVTGNFRLSVVASNVGSVFSIGFLLLPSLLDFVFDLREELITRRVMSSRSDGCGRLWSSQFSDQEKEEYCSDAN
jgi:hypothetical protein